MSAGLDWRLMAGMACGLMGWTPDAFWRATPAEFWPAWQQWARARGLTPDKYMTRDELRELMAQFPDLTRR